MASNVGFVFQEPEAQFVFDIVEDEIAFGLENAGIPREKILSRMNDTIHQLNLEDIRHKQLNEISGGEKQKVAIASALVREPQVLILDEPTSQLDPAGANELLDYITKLKKDLQLTVLISEHRLERLLPFADYIAHLTQNREVLFGTPQEIIPEMNQVPPVILIARQLKISPLPLSVNNFPKEKLPQQIPSMQKRVYERSSIPEYPLEVHNLSAILNKQKILRQINLRLSKGEILVLIGNNGAGKTTLLRSVLGLTPVEGQRKLNGKDMDKMSLFEIIQVIGYLPQNPNDLLFAESVKEELMITLKNHSIQISDSDLSAFLSQFGLNHVKDRYPRNLSVGERQRTALAAITIHKPEIVFLDEPTRGMDYEAKDSLSDFLRGWRDANKAILLITHDIEFAAGIADRVVILEDGQILFDGSPNKAFSSFPSYQTQTSRLFPDTEWITPRDCHNFC